MDLLNILEFSKIERSNKYNGYQLKIAGNALEFFRYVWKNENKPKKGLEDINVVSYNYLFPRGSLNLTTTWNRKKGDYWESKGKKYYFKIKDNRVTIGKFTLHWFLLIKDEQL